jgi:hypothetical protein
MLDGFLDHVLTLFRSVGDLKQGTCILNQIDRVRIKLGHMIYHITKI